MYSLGCRRAKHARGTQPAGASLCCRCSRYCYCLPPSVFLSLLAIVFVHRPKRRARRGRAAHQRVRACGLRNVSACSPIGTSLCRRQQLHARTAHVEVHMYMLRDMRRARHLQFVEHDVARLRTARTRAGPSRGYTITRELRDVVRGAHAAAAHTREGPQRAAAAC